MAKEIKKVVFYTGTPRSFRTTLIGHLYEIARVYPTILLSEKLDSEIEKALKNKILFPKLEKIIPINQFSEGERISFKKNIYLHRLAKDIINKYSPDIVITSSDMHSLFELYLMRFAKKMGAINIAFQVFLLEKMKKIALLVDLTNVYSKLPSFLPPWSRLFLIKCRKYLGHLLFYWIMPLMAKESPFFGKSSYLLRKGNIGMRDADYFIVFSKRDYEICVGDGVAAGKLLILSHPLLRETKNFFNEVFLNLAIRNKNNKKIALLLLPEEEIGFKGRDCALIPKEEVKKTRIRIVKLVCNILSEWEILIKPHPNFLDFKRKAKVFKAISNRVEILEPEEPVDKYVEISDVIIGLPRSVTFVIFTAFLLHPEKPIISLDFFHEILGDYYKDFDGIEYIGGEGKFIKILEAIRDNRYRKEIRENQVDKKSEKEFPNTIATIEHLFRDKIISQL